MNIYLSLIIFLAAVALFILFNRNRAVVYGWLGELALSTKYLSKLNEEYTLINNLLLKKKDGRTSQIDHVIVSPYGIFVIEAKGYFGKVYGGQYKKWWTEYFAGQGFDFYSPIRQNYGHIQTLKEITGLPDKAFISVVVFAKAATLKVHMKNDEGGYVVKSTETVDVIRGHQDVLISDETQEKVIGILQGKNLKSRADHRRHVAEVSSYSE